MRKTAYLALAALALASCSNDDTLRTADPTPIGFSGSFIDNSTRAIDPSYSNSTNNISEFYVWGTLTPYRESGATSPVIQLYKGGDNDKVYSTKDGTTQSYGAAWWCDHVEYWVPNATYKFAAVANHKSVEVGADGLPSKIGFAYNDGSQDLIYTNTVVNVTTDDNASPTSGVTTDKIVAFTFDHLLSLVQFEFTNTSANDNYYYTIENIHLINHPTSATYDVSSSTWSYTSSEPLTADADFGNATNATTSDATTAQIIKAGEGNKVTSHHARMIVPGTYSSLGVSFTKKLYYDIDGNKALDENELIHTKEIAKTALTPSGSTPASVTFSPNCSYKITVDLNPGTEIKFTVKENGINGWGSGSNQEFNP